MPQDARPAGRWLLAALATLWLATCGAGLWVVWSWDSSPGECAQAHARWPADSTLHIEARRSGPAKFRLLMRGFTWIQEGPVNR